MKEWMAAAGATYMTLGVVVGAVIFWSAFDSPVFGAVVGGASALVVAWYEAWKHLDD